MSIDTSKVATTNAHRGHRQEAQPDRRDRRPGPTTGSGLATSQKKNLRKVFPDHWSFMLGEIALWSFVVLLLTGVFLTLWFNPSMGEVQYKAPTTSCAASRCPRRSPRRSTSRSTSAAAC